MKRAPIRESSVERKTAETEVRIKLNLDGTGKSEVNSSLPFLDHMLTLWAKHGFFDLHLKSKGDIEIDDAFFETVDLPKEMLLGGIITEREIESFARGGMLTRGRGSERQSKVLVMVESTPNPKQENPHKKNRIMGFAKMIVMDDLSGTGINYVVKESMSPSSIVISDGYRGFSGLSEIVEKHNAMVVPQKEAHIKLPWVHAVISNAKRNLLGVHHSIGKGFLQNYLNEFVYKLNRRTFESDLFDRMIVAGAHDTWY